MYEKPTFKDKYIGLPDFIFMTNFCDGRGYFIGTKWIDGKCHGTITHKGELKITQKSFDDCLKAQFYVSAEKYIQLIKS